VPKHTAIPTTFSCRLVSRETIVIAAKIKRRTRRRRNRTSLGGRNSLEVRGMRGRLSSWSVALRERFVASWLAIALSPWGQWGIVSVVGLTTFEQ